MSPVEWWAPLGAPGEVHVRELVADDTLRRRALRTENVQEIVLGELVLAGQDLTAEVGHAAYTLSSAAETVVRFTVSETEPMRAHVAGEDLQAGHEIVDVPREADAKIDQFHVLRLRGARGSWVAHFAGGRFAGDRLVLVRGDQPGQDPVVWCVPAPRTRELPKLRLRRRQPADVHLTSWTAAATPAEVALVELLVLCGGHVGLDYLTAGVVGAAREVAGLWRVFTPAPDPLPTRRTATPPAPGPAEGDRPVGFGECHSREGTG